MTEDLLTPVEHDIVARLGELWNDLCAILYRLLGGDPVTARRTT